MPEFKSLHPSATVATFNLNIETTGLCDAAITAAVKAALENQPGFIYVPVFWLMTLAIAALIVITVFPMLISCVAYGMEIKNALKKEQCPEVRAWLLAERKRIKNRFGQCLVGWDELDRFEAKRAKEAKALEAKRMEEARVLEEARHIVRIVSLRWLRKMMTKK